MNVTKPADPDRFRWLCREKKRDCVIGKFGIRIHSAEYVAGGLARLVGRSVDVTWGADKETLEVFYRGEWKTTVYRDKEKVRHSVWDARRDERGAIMTSQAESLEANAHRQALAAARYREEVPTKPRRRSLATPEPQLEDTLRRLTGHSR